MASSAIVVLALVVSTLAFEALLFGDELPEAQFPSFEQPQSGSGFWAALDVIAAIIQAIWGGIQFFFNLLTFNIPGAPWYARVIAGSVLGGALIWSIATLIRGGGGD